MALEYSSIQLEISPVCNNGCISCIGGPHLQNKKKAGFALVKSIVKTLKKSPRHRSVLFTSAEPTLYLGLPVLAKEISDLGFKEIGIQTNGRRLSSFSYAHELVKSGVKNFRISIYSTNPKAHDKITGVKGSFKQTWRGINNLIALKAKNPSIEIGIACVVSKLNITTLCSSLKSFYSLKGINFVTLNSLVVSGRAVKNKDKLLVKYSDVIKECLKFDKMQNHLPPLARERPNITGLPFCVGSSLGMLENRIFETCELVEISGKSLRKAFSGEGVSYIKLPVCRRCAYEKNCPGVQRAYIKKFGVKEFKPVL